MEETTPPDENAPNDAALMSARILEFKSKNKQPQPAAPSPTPTPASGPSRRGAKNKRRKFILLTALAATLFGVLMYQAGAKMARRHDDSMVVTINGEPIKANEFLHRCEISAGGKVLAQMINNRLQLQFAEQKGVLPTTAAIEARYMEYAKQKDFLAKLRVANETPEEFKQDLLVQMAKEAVLDKGVNVTAAEVEQFYKENCDPRNPQARYYHPENVTVAVIITDIEENILKAQKDLANHILFPDVVAKYSKDISRPNNGILPAIRRGQLDPVKLPGLEQKIFDLPIGKDSPPVRVKDPMTGKDNWWIIRCLARAPEASTDPFDKVADDCRNSLAMRKGFQANGEVIQEEEKAFGHNADITFGWTQYNGVIRR